MRLTQSLRQWLFENHRDILPLIMFGHVELLTQEMQTEYLDWCKTDEGKKYLVGGECYKEEIDEATEKQVILKRLRDYRTARGPGCLQAVARATRSRGRINDSVLREILINAEKIPIEDWRKISQALDRLEVREAANG